MNIKMQEPPLEPKPQMVTYGNRHYAQCNNLDEACEIFLTEIKKASPDQMLCSIYYGDFQITITKRPEQQKEPTINGTKQTTT